MKAPTRTKKTEQEYENRAKRIICDIARSNKRIPTPTELAMYVIQKRNTWSKSTWRQVRAALMFHFGLFKVKAHQKDRELLIEISFAEEQLKNDHVLSAYPCREYSGRKSGKLRTSARRRKTISEIDWKMTIDAVRASNSKYRHILEPWMQFGRFTGLRPHEWCQASLIQRGKQGAVLKVTNAKATNGRAHGKYRHQLISNQFQVFIDELDRFINLMREIETTGAYETTRNGCAKLLQRINRKLSGNNKRWIQLYSPRHKFASDAKREHTLSEIAALMGHATDQTASSHYGKRNRHGSVRLVVSPDSRDLSRVRIISGSERRTTKKTGKAPVAGKFKPGME